MKKNILKLGGILCIILVLMPTKEAHSQLAFAEIIRAGIKRVIRAADLKVQRLQNRTIWLQNAQKILENSLSKLKLEEISMWTEKQARQYQEHYLQFKKVRSLIVGYQQVRQIIKLQKGIVEEYKRVWTLLRQDGHFNAQEVEYMHKVYSGILEQSLDNIDKIALILKSFQLDMTDNQRMVMIEEAGSDIRLNHRDLVEFNRQNVVLSMQRAKDKQEIKKIKKLYNIP